MLRRLRRNQTMNFLSMPRGTCPEVIYKRWISNEKKRTKRRTKKIVAYPTGVVVIQSMADGEEWITMYELRTPIFLIKHQK